MALYQEGYCSATTGSNVITGTSTLFTSNVGVGDSFKFNGESAIYDVISVDSDTQLKISPVYANPDKSSAAYQILTLGSRTPNLGLAEMVPGLQDWTYWLTSQTIRKLDARIGQTGVMVGEAASQAQEDALFAAGYTFVARTDLMGTTSDPSLDTLWIDARSYATLAAADAAAVAAGKQLVISSQWDTVPAELNAAIRVLPGGKINNAGALAINGTFEGADGCFIGAGTISGLKKARPEWWGANATPGTTDMTSAIQAALNAAQVVTGAGNYAITHVTASTTGQKIMLDTVTLLSDGTYVGVTLSGASTSFHVRKFDGGSTGRTGISVAADQCRVLVDEILNINSTDASTAYVSGVQVDSGSGSDIQVYAHDFVRNATGSGSTPRVLTVQGTSNGTTGNVWGVDVHGLLTATTDSHFGIVHGVNCADNGLYHLSGSVVIDNLFYAGSEEAVVTELGDLSIGHFLLRGAAHSALGLQDAGNVFIGELVVEQSAGASVRQLVNTRAGNTTSGKVAIGRIVGTMTGAYLSYLTTGTVDFLQIGSIDLTYNYDAGVSASPAYWWNIAACKGFAIRNARIKVIDVNSALTSGVTYFSITAPTTNLTKKSVWQNVSAEVVLADGVTAHTNAAIRGYSLTSPLIYHTGSTFQDVSANIYWTGGTTDNAMIGSAAPTGGTWRSGTDLVLLAKTAAPFRARCTVAGTPGTWVTY